MSDAELVEKLKLLIRILPEIMEKAGNELPFVLSGYFESNMKLQEVTGAYRDGGEKATNAGPNKTSTLRSLSGRLRRAFNPHQSKEGRLKITVQNGQLEVDYEILVPYAEIHEYGGFVKATPVTVKRKSKTGKEFSVNTYKMSQFFWAMYIKNKQDWYKGLALKVMKDGGMNIKARPYFHPGLQKFRDKGYKIWLEQVLNKVIEVWNA